MDTVIDIYQCDPAFCGIAMLWIVPYYQTVFANFYLEIKAEYEAAGNAA